MREEDGEVVDKEASRATGNSAKGVKRKKMAKAQTGDDDGQVEEGDFLDEDDAPTPRKKAKTTSKRNMSKASTSISTSDSLKADNRDNRSDSEDDAGESKQGTRKNKVKHHSSQKSSGSRASAKDHAARKDEEHEEETEQKSITSTDPAKVKSPKANDSDAEDHSDSSAMSIVLDGPASKAASSRQAASTTRSKQRPTKPTTTPAPSQVQTLQRQLVACGVRKIWQFELRAYGDDEPAKIRHLQRLLVDAGLTGRFSAARAREIKEARELMADVEAVREGERSWGMESAAGRGRRARERKSAAEKMRGDVDEDDDEEEDEEEKHGKDNDDNASSDGEDGEEEDETGAEKRKRLRRELDFLGDDSDSE